MIKIIPTTHLMSKEAIEGIIKDENPEVIGIELCDLRAVAIFDELTKEIINKKNPKPNNLLDKITNSIKEKAEKQNLDYGSDMKTALRFASDNKIIYALVDMPITKTQELFSKIPKEEQQGFLKELQEFQSQDIKENVNEEEVLTTLKERYPIAFEFLVNMRNLYIANQILLTERDNQDKRVIVFLGSAHAEQVKKLIGETK